jgi:SOS-response transcriptional repressor LexA
MTNWGLSEALRVWRKSKRHTQEEIAEALGMTRGGYANYEAGTAPVPNDKLAKLRRMGFQSGVSSPSIPMETLRAPVPYIGLVAASSMANWTDPNDTDTMEFVPSEMAEARGRFACRIEGDSMFDLLWPDDLCVSQQDPAMKIGAIILHRSSEGMVTIKQLKHNGTSFILHPLNPSYEDCLASGVVVG